MPGLDAVLGNSALKRRTITALSLVPLVIAAILWLPTPAFALVVGAVMAIAAWEWCALAGLVPRAARVAYLALLALVMVALWGWPHLHVWMLGISALWWAAQMVALARVREVARVEGLQARLLATGVLVLVGPWVALVHLHGQGEQGPALVLFLMFLMWTADSMAYFTGRAWGAGRARLAPALSPGKTRVGVYGAMVGAAVCGLVFAWLQDAGLARTLATLLICAVSVVISVVGDLYESLLKRRRALKDSGQLLPGHGGMLDRIDSLTAAAPVFALGITLVNL